MSEWLAVSGQENLGYAGGLMVKPLWEER